MVGEHLIDDSDYESWVYQHSEDLIRRQIQSGHKSQTKYNVGSRIDIQDKNDPVKDYYCVRPAGKKKHWHVCTHS